MENRTQLEVRKLFLTFLSKVSKRKKNILLKTLETIVAEFRRNKGSKQNSKSHFNQSKNQNLSNL